MKAREGKKTGIKARESPKLRFPKERKEHSRFTGQ